MCIYSFIYVYLYVYLDVYLFMCIMCIYVHLFPRITFFVAKIIFYEST